MYLHKMLQFFISDYKYKLTNLLKMHIAILLFFLLISLENTIQAEGMFQPLILANLKYDPILKIERAMTLNIPHKLWAACPAESDVDEQVQMSSVSKNAVIVKKKNDDEDFNNFKCKSRILPVVVRNKLDNKILEIGFEVYIPTSMHFNIDPRQSNENIQPKQADKFGLFSNYMKKSNNEQFAWISVLSAKINKKEFHKEIHYEILNANYPEDPIICSYEMKRGGDLINENDFTSEFEYEDEISNIIHSPNQPTQSPYILEFLVPKNHLVNRKQEAACTLQNLISISTEISSLWTKTNEFILNVAKKLGRLKIIAGTIGVIKDSLPAGGYKRAIPKFNGNDVPVPAILWRVVKHVVKRQRYENDLEFGIIIINHNNTNPVEAENPICHSICQTNHWKIEGHPGSVMTYCCPVNNLYLKLLGLKDESKFVHELNLEDIVAIKEKYEDFDKSYKPIGME